MSAAEHEAIDPDEIWMLVLDVPAMSDLPDHRPNLRAMRGAAETLAAYAEERGAPAVEARQWRTETYDTGFPLVDVPAGSRDYVADRMRHVLDMQGYEEVNLVYQRR